MPSPVMVSVSPSSASVPAGSTQPFTATVSHATNTAVTWQVGGVAGGSATLGTISSTGVYTAPLSPPSVGQVEVTAISMADSTKSASAKVTPVFSDASFTGTYVFRASTTGITGFYFTAGVLTADGNGKISSGTEDINDKVNGPRTNIPFSGTYTVGQDGRGLATLATAWGTSTLKFVLLSNTGGQLIEFDNAAVTSGFVSAQDASAISAIAGTFVFGFQGVDVDPTSIGPVSSVGQVVINGSGAASGVLDINERGTFAGEVPFTGNFSIGAQGRGKAVSASSYGTSNYIFYIVDAKTIVFLNVDPAPGLIETGTALAQQNISFNNGSLGSSVYLLSGVDATLGTTFAAAGRFDTDGAGSFQNGLLDENHNAFFDGSPFSGSYSVASNGRGTGSVNTSTGTSTFVFWLASPGNALLLESDNGVAAGSILGQASGGFLDSSMTGNFAFGLAGSASGAPFTGSGKVVSDGMGGFTGTEDLNDGGLTTADVAMTGTYSINPNGRGTVSFSAGGGPTTSNRVHLINPSSFVFISADRNQPVVGLAEKQCSDCH